MKGRFYRANERLRDFTSAGSISKKSEQPELRPSEDRNQELHPDPPCKCRSLRDSGPSSAIFPFYKQGAAAAGMRTRTHIAPASGAFAY